MVVFGRASIVPFVALPVIIGLCRSDTGFFRMIQEAFEGTDGDGRGHDDPFMVGQQRRIHRSREIAEHLGPYGRHIGSWGDAYRLPLSIEATRGSRSQEFDDLELRPLIILRCIFTLYSPCAFRTLLSHQGSERHRIADSQTIFFGLGLHSAHCRMGRVSPRLVPQMDRALQHTANFPAYLR